MKRSSLVTFCAAVGALACLPEARAAISLYAEYHLGESGSLGASNIPLDAVGGRHIDNAIDGASASVGGGGGYAGSTAFLDTSNPANSGFYHPSNFSDLANDNFAIGVYAKASSLDAANHGTIFGTGEGGLDLALHANGWAGSFFNVAWIAEPGGVTGSFTPDTWAHLALIRADGVTTFYIDGVAQPGTSMIVPTNGLPHLSVSPGGASFFDGGIDEARVVTFDSGESTGAILNALSGVPEPSTFAFMAVACLALVRRRRS